MHSPSGHARQRVEAMLDKGEIAGVRQGVVGSGVRTTTVSVRAPGESSGSSVTGEGTPARTASSCAEKASPKSSARDVSCDQSRSANIPVRGPYTVPNEDECEMYSASSQLNSSQRTSATPAPTAS